MKNVCFFSEMKLFQDQGPVSSFIQENSGYNKEKVIKYLKSGEKIASCPRRAIDCVTGNKISNFFSLHTDGEFCWGDFLVYHLEKYNIELPREFLKKIGA
ncbi:MAG: hypothetical protein Q4B64_07845 [Spirochaetales bacterium]|nr:hypothetical protein [Spirochaetales bacterium]